MGVRHTAADTAAAIDDDEENEEPWNGGIMTSH